MRDDTECVILPTTGSPTCWHREVQKPRESCHMTSNLPPTPQQVYLLRLRKFSFFETPPVFQGRAKELYWSYLKHSGNPCIMMRFTHYIFPPREMRASLPVGALVMRNECFSLLPVRNLKTWCKNHSGITTYSPAGTLIS